MSKRSSRSRVIASGLLLLSAPAVTACGGGGDRIVPVHTAASGTVFNDADADFTTGLVKQRAEEMALVDVATGKTLSPELTAFLDDARNRRSTDVETAITWLADCDLDVPETVRDHAHGDHADEGAHDDVLASANGAAFEEAWVAAFLDELEDSDALAAAEQKDGRNASALALADDVETATDDESDRLEDLAG